MSATLMAALALFTAIAHGAEPVISPSTSTFSVDPYAVLEKVGHRANLPRLLSTEDADMTKVVPEDLQPVVGDFDGDGERDIAITGVYNLPPKTGRYFLLVAGGIDHKKPVVLFSTDGPEPFFLHRPGTTGEAEPEHQAFAVTNCVNCSTGMDFQWNNKGGRFARTPWVAGRITHVSLKPVAPAPDLDVPDAVADQALQIVGKLADVQAYVAEVKTGGGKLGTRVEPLIGTEKRVRVLIFQKRDKEEKPYDTIVVDLESGKIVSRKRT